jgi:abelson tyrosine-protein kinase 1
MLWQTSIQIRTLKLVKATELRQQDLLESLSHVSPSLPLARPFLPPALQSFPTDPESVRNTLHAVSAVQNAQDRACDMADLHKLMRAALAAKDDVAMFEVFQIARNDMPEAIKTLERTLKRDVHDEELDAEEITMALPSSQEAPGRVNGPPLDPGNASANHSSANTLDREFIVTGIEALRRLSKGADLGLPSWTITWLEVELEKQVGVGSFSDVYRGTWRKRTVAVKVLDKTTPPKIFLREVKIWKSLNHPNVLKLFGASSASGDPPWFLVRGSLFLDHDVSVTWFRFIGMQVLSTGKPRQVLEGPEPRRSHKNRCGEDDTRDLEGYGVPSRTGCAARRSQGTNFSRKSDHLVR